jgi:hypothetical protein
VELAGEMDKTGGEGPQRAPTPAADSGSAVPLPGAVNLANFPLFQLNSFQALQSLAAAHWGPAAHIAASGAEKAQIFGLSPALPSQAIENGAAAGGAGHAQSVTALLKRKDPKDEEGEKKGGLWREPTHDEQCGGDWLAGKRVRVYWDVDDRSELFLFSCLTSPCFAPPQIVHVQPCLFALTA